MKFSELTFLREDSRSVLAELGFDTLTPIQEKVLEPILQKQDVVGLSATGSGKTLAYVLPLLENLELAEKLPQILVLAPTRELCAQIVKEFRRFGRHRAGMQVALLVGGVSSREQVQSLISGAQIVVGTPGRVLDLMIKGKVRRESLRALVLDEADRMLDMGFEKEMQEILSMISPEVQSLLFSATWPDGVDAISSQFQKAPLKIEIQEEEGQKPQIAQLLFEMGQEDKRDLLLRVLQQYATESVLIFCNQKNRVVEIADLLRDEGVPAGALHGDLEQRERDGVLAQFRNNSLSFLVATDIAARGLDIESLDLVVNLDFPTTSEVYVHRIGRTGRAGRPGTSVLFAGPKDALRLAELEKLTGSKFERPKLGFKNQHGLAASQFQPKMRSLWIAGGRQDKLRPGDILGALTGKSVDIPSSEIGKIEIQESCSFVGLRRETSKMAFEKLRNAKIKNKKFQLRLL